MANPKQPNGSERTADEKRGGGGPRYHGGSWRKADTEREVASERPPEAPPGDGAVKDPGTRGAVFGKGGKGIVERDEQRVKKPGEGRTRRSRIRNAR